MGVSDKRKTEIKFYLTKDNLKKAYSEGYSSNYIAKKYFSPDFTCDTTTVIKYAKSFGLNAPNLKTSANLKSVREKYKETNRRKYGVENVSQSKDIKEKKKRRALEVYGVENVFQSKEIKEKSKKTCLEKYGLEHPGSLSGQKCRRSGFQISVEEQLLKNNIDFQSEVYSKFCKYNTFLKRKYNPIVDILIESSKIVIECNGDLWHANPNLYKGSDIIYKYEGPVEAKYIWDFDKSREDQIKSFGYKLIVVWENDWKNNQKLETKRIINEIKNSKN